MRIFLTGATGFVGAHVLGHLLAQGHVVLYLIRSQSDDWRIAEYRGHPNAYACYGDMASSSSYSPFLKDFKPQAVLHLAWQGVSGAHRDAQSQELNYDWTMSLLETSLEAGISHFIGLGSQAEYGPCNMVISEDCTAAPVSLYGQMKLKALKNIKKLCEESGITYSWIRLFSAYGPKDGVDFLIPYLCRQFTQGLSPALTPCEQQWDYIHIADCATAISLVLENGCGGVFNLGSGESFPLRQIVERLRDHINPSVAIGFGQKDYAIDQIMHLQADVSHLKRQTGWSPQVPLLQGLKETADWYKAFYKGDI